MHQIRAHLAHLGYPILGDKIYVGDESCYLRFMKTGWSPEIAHNLIMERHATDGVFECTANCPQTWLR